MSTHYGKTVSLRLFNQSALPLFQFHDPGDISSEYIKYVREQVLSDTSFFSLDGPLDPLPGETQMRASNFIGFPDLVRKLGGDPRSVLERHGLDPVTIRDPDYYIDCQAMVDVFEYCGKTFDEPLFGLKLAQFQEPDVYGCVATLCRTAATMREAVESVCKYMPIAHAPATHMELVETRETAEIVWRTKAELGNNSQASLQGTMLNVKLLRQVGGPNFRPLFVDVVAKIRQEDIPEIENIMGCKFSSSANVNRIAFHVRTLDQPIASANKLVFRLLKGYLDRVRAVSRKSVKERVEDYVRGSLPTGLCSIERCAKKLGISVRTLQAQLADHGLKFSHILEKQRIELAREYLANADISLDETSAMLGYSEQSSFGRAFKRWTGMTPQRYRATYQV